MDARVSDAERQEVVDRLRQGCSEGRLTLDEFSERVGDVYAARTAGELGRVTADLPAPARPAAADRGQPVRRVVAVMGGARQRGRWRPGRPTLAAAVMGGCVVDLCEAELDGAEIEIRAVAFMGGVEVLVPEGVDVELTGLVLFGSRDDRVRRGALVPGAPVVRVRATVVMGGVTARTRAFRRPR